MMLEDTTVPCPFCDNEIKVRTIAMGKAVNYIVRDNCPHCGKPADRVASALNKRNSRSKFKVEKSYIKLDPRG